MAKLADQANRLKRDAASPLPALILMTDAARLPDPLAAAEALPRGSAVILRHYGDRRRPELAQALSTLARARGLMLLIGDDPALARQVGAHGVHLRERSLASAHAVRWRSDWLVTTATHSSIALTRAARFCADAALLSPIFPTASHVGSPVLGVGRFTSLVRASALPVYALGGITADNAGWLAGSGAVGIAGIGGLSSPRPT